MYAKNFKSDTLFNFNSFSGHDSVSYEIIKHPHNSYIQTHSSSIDYDHRSDYGEELDYNHRNRRHFFDKDRSQIS